MVLRFGAFNFYLDPNHCFRSAHAFQEYRMSRVLRFKNARSITHGGFTHGRMEIYGCCLPDYFYLQDYVFDEDVYQNADMLE